MRANSILVVALSATAVWTSFAGTVALPAVAGEARQPPPTAAQFGILLASNQEGLMVARVSGAFATFGLRPGDQVVAVNGRRVTTERAFVGRLMAGNGGVAANILVSRNGQALQIAAGPHVSITQSAAAPSSASAAGKTQGGFINPANMVITSDGRIMHKAVAARLGLESRPLQGSVAEPPAVN